MIFLAGAASNPDKLQLITSATPGGSGVNVHASYADSQTSGVTVAPQNARITTATTTDIVSGAGASIMRNVKNLKISNDGTVSQNIILQILIGGATAIILETVTLAAGERFGYEEGVGQRVFDAAGREKEQIAPLEPDQNNVTADQTISGVDAYITGSDYNIVGRLKVGSIIRWRMVIAKTDAVGVATPIFNIRVGTAGAIGDTARCIMTGRAQTAVADTAEFDIEAHMRIVGASAVWQAVMGGDHGLATTGMSTGGFANQVASSAFDMTPANTKAGISINPGASSVWVVKTCSVEGIFLLA